jgi:nitroimidazol reductase NimA-like FMN-containing flavoprotein (pyridoxamine 5'-phosphate oxidase superfamily)
MDILDGSWSQEETETFLESALVPIRLGCHRPDGGLWMLSLWYEYRDGVFRCATEESADVVRFLRANPELSFEVSTNCPPYMGVRGNGTARIDTEGATDLLRSLIERYLGTTEADLARWLLSDDRDEVTIAIDPERLHTWDFSERMQDVATDSPAAHRAEPASPKHE